MAMLRAALLAGLVLAACCAAVSISGSEKPTVLEGPVALPAAAPEEPRASDVWGGAGRV